MKRSTRNRFEKKARIWKNIIANQVFKDYCFDGNLDEICEKIKKHRGVILNFRKYLLKTLRMPDHRTTANNYGYESLKQIMANLYYISDRFGAEIRLIWLSQVPEQVERLKGY